MTDEHSERLAKALDDAGFTQLAARARQEMFSDFKSPLDAPKLALVTALRTKGEEALAKRVIDGEFDG